MGSRWFYLQEFIYALFFSLNEVKCQTFGDWSRRSMIRNPGGREGVEVQIGGNVGPFSNMNWLKPDQ